MNDPERLKQEPTYRRLFEDSEPYVDPERIDRNRRAIAAGIAAGVTAVGVSAGAASAGVLGSVGVKVGVTVVALGLSAVGGGVLWVKSQETTPEEPPKVQAPVMETEPAPLPEPSTNLAPDRPRPQARHEVGKLEAQLRHLKDAQSLFDAGRFQEVLAKLNDLDERFDNHEFRIESGLLRVKVLSRLNRDEGALDFADRLETMLRERPHRVALWEMRSISLSKLGRCEEARNALRYVIGLGLSGDAATALRARVKACKARQ